MRRRMLRLALALLVCATVRALGAQRACEDLCAVRHAATACSKCADGQLARAAAYSARGARLCLRGGGEHGAEEEGPPNLGDQQCPNVEPAVALSTLVREEDKTPTEMPAASVGPLSLGERALLEGLRNLSVNQKKTSMRKLVGEQVAPHALLGSYAASEES